MCRCVGVRSRSGMECKCNWDCVWVGLCVGVMVCGWDCVWVDGVWVGLCVGVMMCGWDGM